MSLHGDLLEQARHLAKRERKRPKQASLRRAVSAAYYALFHLLVREATELFLSGNAREPLRQRLARVFSHADMKDASKAYNVKPSKKKLAAVLAGLPATQPELLDVAGAFVELQEARHQADYNTEKAFTRSESNDLIDQAEQAFADWKQIRKTLPADAYLVTLLTWQRLRS